MLAPRVGRCEPPTMVIAAQHLVGHLTHSCAIDIADHNLIAVTDDDAVDRPSLMGAPTPAPAQCRHLKDFDAVGKLDEACRSREETRAEVGRDTEGIDIDAELIHDIG